MCNSDRSRRCKQERRRRSSNLYFLRTDVQNNAITRPPAGTEGAGTRGRALRGRSGECRRAPIRPARQRDRRVQRGNGRRIRLVSCVRGLGLPQLRPRGSGVRPRARRTPSGSGARHPLRPGRPEHRRLACPRDCTRDHRRRLSYRHRLAGLGSIGVVPDGAIPGENAGHQRAGA